MKLIHSLTRTEILEYCRNENLPSFRADQLWRWLYVQKISSWDEMKNISSTIRSRLAEMYSLESAVVTRVEGEEGSTRKALIGLPDGDAVEEVLLPESDRRTVCISCQVGCRFKCAFCASGQAGFKRNLECGEMIGQFLTASRMFDNRVSNLVFMGMGEPFDNYDEVLKAARIINDEKGINLGARKITISTCGIIPGIRRFTDEDLQLKLSVSLHAPTDELRSRLMPVNRKYPLKDLIDACKAYTDKTGRIITFEYTLIKDVNDSPMMAEQLASLLKPLHSRVNLIPLSVVDEFDAKSADAATAESFVEILVSTGTNATLRNSKGSAVKAACGQLRYRK